jgi:hypothetical protein
MISLANSPPSPWVCEQTGRYGLRIFPDSTLRKYRHDGTILKHEARRWLWKKFQMISTLPERDQQAVARLSNSLFAAGASRKNGSMGEHNGR